MTGLEAGGALAQSAVGISKELGIIDAVKQKLVRQPDRAASKLAAVLDELQKSYLAFESELVKFFAITLDPGPDLRSDMQTLYSLESPQLWARLSDTRGKCGKIKNIYNSYLSPWFQRVTDLNQQERAELDALFQQLSDIDAEWVKALDQAAYWLGQRAEAVLAACEKGETKSAQDLIASARREIGPVRRQLAQSLADMQHLEADFIEASGVT